MLHFLEGPAELRLYAHSEYESVPVDLESGVSIRFLERTPDARSDEKTAIARYRVEKRCILTNAEAMYHEPPRSNSPVVPYTMKRTNLVLDPRLLEEATRVLRVKTYSAAVNTALREVLRVRRIQRLPEFFGTDIWEGDLAEMREHRPNGHGQRRPRSRE
jgi:Arc/MetJ family transcription regulator